MTCTWCPNEATQIGRAPTGTVGRTELPSCAVHNEVLKKLGYTLMPDDEFRKTLRREAKEAKK